MMLNNTKFDSSSKNLKAKKLDKTDEIDIFLINGNTIGIIEVKTKVTSETIKQLQNITDSFGSFYPEFKDYKIYGAIAGKVFPDNLQKEVIDKGWMLLTVN